MIDLTPLDVRKKKGDFRQGMRGYDRAAVDDFLDLIAERFEELVRENAALKERVAVLSEAIAAYRERERAMNEALVSAQQLREDVRAQAAHDAELALHEARIEAERIVARANDEARITAEATERIQAQRTWFLRSFRALVERQLGEVEQEEERLRELRDMAWGAPPEPAYPTYEQPVAPPREEEEPAPAPWLASIDEEGREGR